MFGSEKRLCPKGLGSEKVWVRIVVFFWVRKDLDPKRPTFRTKAQPMDGRTDGWLAGTFKQIIALCSAR